jgi:hypothetical protein
MGFVLFPEQPFKKTRQARQIILMIVSLMRMFILLQEMATASSILLESENQVFESMLD